MVVIWWACVVLTIMKTQWIFKNVVLSNCIEKTLKEFIWNNVTVKKSYFIFLFITLLCLNVFVEVIQDVFLSYFLTQVVEVYGLLALGMSLWNQLVVPVLFMVFWLVLFALQIYSYFSTRDQPASRERLLFLFLTR